VALGAVLIALGAGGLTYLALHDDRGAAPQALVIEPTTTPEQPSGASFTPTPEPSSAAIARLQIPGIGVDASVVTLGVDADGTMQAPSTPTDVGWYDFSARPGRTGNAVFAGHVDYIHYGPAVFWRLHELQPGDEVDVVLVDGSRFAYRVTSVTAYDDATAPVAEIVGPTAAQSVTLITCTGVFDSTAHNYNQRLVVRAEPSSAALAKD
jgi:LPXTG-site transpeptidase (sortase) family protein